MDADGKLRALVEKWRREGVRLNGGADKPYTGEENSIRALVLGFCSDELDAALSPVAGPVTDEMVELPPMPTELLNAPHPVDHAAIRAYATRAVLNDRAALLAALESKDEK